MLFKDYLTYEEYSKNFFELLQLELFVIWKYCTITNETVKSIINQKLLLLKISELFKNHESFINNLSTDAEMALSESVYRIDSALFINEFFEKIKSNIEDVLHHKYTTDIATPAWCTFGCFSYEIFASDKNKIFLHIGNSAIPDSFLDDETLIKKSLLAVMDDAEKNHSINTLTTETWLNSHEKWLRFFPDEWMSNMTAPTADLVGHLGYWGQFINKKGCINLKNASFFKETGKLPYPVKRSFCSFDSLRKKLIE